MTVSDDNFDHASSDRALGDPARGDASASQKRKITPWPEPKLDRMAASRGDADAVRTLFEGCQLLLVGPDGQFPVQRDADEAALVATPPGAFDPVRDLLIGSIGGRPWFARPSDANDVAALGTSETLRASDIRDGDREVAAAAVALLYWHRSEPRCDRCHGETTMVVGGGSRTCAQGHDNFPRTDPAVIMALVDSRDRLLLAHQRVWPAGRCSVLAGFVEAGESAEAALAREVAEEVGLRTGEIHYLHSQPWPFPRSLMLGFAARADGEPQPDGVEIEWARWFSRDEVTEQLASGELSLPGAASIAGRMIERWRAGHLLG